jgi:glycosyltransferase involved in cell wall biosynthesis
MSRRPPVAAASGEATIALAHDYLTQRGGAERVALMMAQAFPQSALHTTLYHRQSTFPEFADIDVQVSPLDRISLLRSHHRLAFPVLAPAVSSMYIEADVLLVSSSGWAHGIRTSGRKVVYCHSPARWLYQTHRYLGNGSATQGERARTLAARGAVRLLGAGLRRWDRQAAATAARYVANSTATRDAILRAYDIQAEVLPPPPALLPDGEESAVGGIEPGAVLCVARLLPYKNVDLVLQAVEQIPGMQLVVAGDGPDRTRLAEMARSSGRVRFVGRVSDPQLRWLYRTCTVLVAASYEDYGLSPLEAAGFGHPTIALRAGGYLDTVEEGRTGAFFEGPTVDSLRAALESFDPADYDPDALRRHAATFSRQQFGARLNAIVAEELDRRGAGPQPLK